MNEGPLGVHEVELVVQPGPGLGDGSCVGQHADGPRDLNISIYLKTVGGI